MVVLLWTRCWTCSFQLNTEFLQKKYRVISITDDECIKNIHLQSVDLILLYWPTFNDQDLQYCLALKQLSNAKIHIISRYVDVSDYSLFELHNIHFQTDPTSEMLYQLGVPSTTRMFARKSKASLELVHSKRTVKVGMREVELSRREFEMLEYMFEHAGKVIDREALIHSLWNGVASDANVYITIQKLRGKIEEDPHRPQHIITKKGGGYMLCI